MPASTKYCWKKDCCFQWDQTHLLTLDGSTHARCLEVAIVGTRGSVRIRAFSVNSVVRNDVLEGLVHETTVASLDQVKGVRQRL